MDTIESATIIVAAYDSKTGAHDALEYVKRHRSEEDLEIYDGVTLRKDEKGRIRVTETADWSGKKGMMVGGIAGAAIGVLTGGVGWLMVGGAAVVGLASRLRDSGFDNDQLRQVTSHLSSDTSALLFVCHPDNAIRCAELCRETDCLELYLAQLDMATTAELTVVDALELAEPPGIDF